MYPSLYISKSKADSSKEEKEKKEKPKPQNKPIDGFSARARKISRETPKEESAEKDLTSSQRTRDKLAWTFSMSTVSGGFLKSFLKDTLPDGRRLWEVCQMRIQYVQLILRLTQRCLFEGLPKAFEWDVDPTGATHSFSGGSTTFMESLMRFWSRKVRRLNSHSSQKDPLYLLLEAMFKDIVISVDSTQVDTDWCHAKMFQGIAKTLNSSMGGLITGRTTELEEAVQLHLQEHPENVWINAALDYIGRNARDDTERFFLLNTILPPGKRFKLTPNSGAVNHFIHLSELEFFHLATGSGQVKSLTVQNSTTREASRTFTEDSLRESPGAFFHFLFTHSPDLQSGRIVQRWRSRRKSASRSGYKSGRSFIFIEHAKFHDGASTTAPPCSSSSKAQGIT